MSDEQEGPGEDKASLAALAAGAEYLSRLALDAGDALAARALLAVAEKLRREADGSPGSG